MSDTLLIHYNIENAQQATWALCNNDGELTGKITTGTLAELSEASADRTSVVLLNSHCLHINQLQLPTQNLQKLLKAVPYAIEEYIADDVEDFHFVVARNSSFTSVVGIKKATLNNILQVFHDAGINPEKIIPDALCLAADDGEQWACLNYKKDSYLQTDVRNGLIISHDILPYIIDSKLHDEKQDKPKKILLFSEQDDATAFDQLKEKVIDDDADIELINIVYNSHPLVVFCGNYKRAMPLNLLQYDFKPKRKTSGYWQHWRLAASLAAVWLVLHLGLTAFQYSQLKDANIITRANIEKIYKQSFPQSRKIVNPRVQMEQKLDELKGSAGGSSKGLLFLLAESFGTLSHDKDNITLQSLTFRNNRMDIGLEGSNLQAVETLNKNLNNNKKIRSEITSSSSEKDKVKGNLRIEAGS